MSKQKERERKIIKKKQQNARLLIFSGIVIILIVSISFLLFNRQPENNEALPIGHMTTNDFHSLAFSPIEAETVFFGHHEGLLISRDGGKSWSPTTLKNADAMAFVIPQSDPQVMYAAGHDVFFKSTDGGKTWESMSTNLPGTDIHGFSVDPENADQVYANVVGFGVFGSQDGGSTWSLLSNTAPQSTFNLAIGETSKTLYAAAGEAGLWQSQDGGHTWNLIQNVPDRGAIAVAYVPGNGRIYVTTLGDLQGLYVSDDQGQSWKSAGLDGLFLAIAASPLDPNHILTVNSDGEVFASHDGGISWSGK